MIDPFSRRVVGWSMKAEMTGGLVTDALGIALWRRGKPDALLHHSDNGTQYTSQHFQELMAETGVTCAMGRSGNVWDDAAMKSFFSALETKWIRVKSTGRVTPPKAVERFCDTICSHSTIGYGSLAEFEKKAGSL